MYISTNEVIQWKTEKKEQPHLITGKGRNNPQHQDAAGTKAHTSKLVKFQNQNFQENWKKMQRHICYGQMTGWKHIVLMKI